MIRSRVLFAAVVSFMGLGSVVGIATKARSQTRTPEQYVVMARCLGNMGAVTVPKEGTPGPDICPPGYRIGCSTNWTLRVDGSARNTDVCLSPLPGSSSFSPPASGVVTAAVVGGPHGASGGVPANAPANAPPLVGYTCQAGYALLIENNYLTCKRATAPVDYQAPVLR